MYRIFHFTEMLQTNVFIGLKSPDGGSCLDEACDGILTYVDNGQSFTFSSAFMNRVEVKNSNLCMTMSKAGKVFDKDCNDPYNYVCQIQGCSGSGM